MESQVLGIFQTDVAIQAGIEAALADLRANPWLLDYAFAYLVRDTLTAAKYGAKERDKAKQWFLNNDIPVVMDYRAWDAPKYAMISVSIVDSVEAETTLGDVNHDPQEETEAENRALTSTFTPRYDASTGTVTLPSNLDIVVSTGMEVVDRRGVAHPITSVESATTIVLTPGLVVDLTSCYIRSISPRFLTQLESLNFKESVRIGAHVKGDPIELLWLFSIMKFILLRYKQTFFEGRNFERSTIAWSAMAKDDRFGPELYWTRFCTMTGYSRDYWPKLRTERIQGTSTGFKVSQVGSVATTFVEEDDLEGDAPWSVEDESTSVRR